MGGFIAKQPNGKYCRFSTVVDCFTHINMTLEDYVRVIMERGKQEWKAREEAEDIFKNYIFPFEEAVNRFIPNNMTEKQFNKCLEKCRNKDACYEKL